ncbi:caspase family protein [Roseospira goensis]|uniref:Caspase family p20 domain-containing protein n=1 Tax=Roseospira goensis TaxID=391922 RepID=A0A7W6S0B9_9PROT|nr:hypothetical protein [Roseospira goensis]
MSGNAPAGGRAPRSVLNWLGAALVAGLLILVAAAPAAAEAAGAAPDQETRVALVIGNGGYDSGSLSNPTNDAIALSRALRDVGFDVTTLVDATRQDMRRAYIEFGRRLSDGGVGLFYYAGHGVQVHGENYLIPVDAVIEDQAHVEVEGVNVRDILARMGGARNRLNIVILDACRDNPFKSVMRSGGGRGLARTSAPTGTYLAYATAPDQVALDGEDTRNSPFTGALLTALEEPGQDLDDIFLSVRRDVMARTDDRQVPWVSNSITGQFYFRPPAPEPAAPAQQATRSIELAAPPIPQSPPAGSEGEVLFWESIMDANQADLYREYLSRWPDGTYAPIARLRLDRLESASAQAGDGEADAAAAPAAPDTPAAPDAATVGAAPLWPTGRPAPGTSVADAAGTAGTAGTGSRGGAPPRPQSAGLPPSPVPQAPTALGADGSNDPDARDGLGRTALMIAARDNDTARLRKLLDVGASLELRAPDGNTALTLAAWEGHVESARLLLDAGADPTAEGPAGAAWEGLARTAAGTALLEDVAARVPTVGETLLGPSRQDWREVQARLNALGFGAGGVDGRPGPRTRGALQAFQGAHGLPATGYLTTASLTRLRALQPQVRVPQAQPRRRDEAPAPMVPVLVHCESVGAVLGGSGADLPNPYNVTLPESMRVERVQVEAHDDVGFFTNAVLHMYLDNGFIGRRDVKAAGSTLSYAVGRNGRSLQFYSREEDGITGDEETFIHTIRVFALRPKGTPDARCR